MKQTNKKAKNENGSPKMLFVILAVTRTFFPVWYYLRTQEKVLMSKTDFFDMTEEFILSIISISLTKHVFLIAGYCESFRIDVIFHRTQSIFVHHFIPNDL